MMEIFLRVLRAVSGHFELVLLYDFQVSHCQRLIHFGFGCIIRYFIALYSLSSIVCSPDYWLICVFNNFEHMFVRIIIGYCADWSLASRHSHWGPNLEKALRSELRHQDLGYWGGFTLLQGVMIASIDLRFSMFLSRHRRFRLRPFFALFDLVFSQGWSALMLFKTGTCLIRHKNRMLGLTLIQLRLLMLLNHAVDGTGLSQSSLGMGLGDYRFMDESCGWALLR